MSSLLLANLLKDRVDKTILTCKEKGKESRLEQRMILVSNGQHAIYRESDLLEIVLYHYSFGGWKEDSDEVFSSHILPTRRAFSLTRDGFLYATFAENMTALC